MPFFQIDQKLVYYAHVPKCGGSAIANYIQDRFGPLAFHDNPHVRRPQTDRWTATSPQHVDAAMLERLIPLSFFSSLFTIVRHPVTRAGSIYHFQKEVQQSIPHDTSFTAWLEGLEAQHVETPFAYDNHTRPMDDIAPEGATVFHLEHGLDALVQWFDVIEGEARGARRIAPANTRGEFSKTKDERVQPSRTDLDLIARIYAADFKRFGYTLDQKTPRTPAPEITPEFIAARDRDRARASHPVAWAKRKVLRKIQRL